MTFGKTGWRVLCAALVFTLGCRSVQIEAGAASSPSATPPVATPITASPTSNPERKPTAAVASAPFTVTVDDQQLTAESLPSPEAFYATELATHGSDLSACQAAPTPVPGACPK